MVQKIPAAKIAVIVLIIIVAGSIVLTVMGSHETDQPVPSGIGVKANPAAATTATTRITTAHTTPPPSLISAGITIDPISDMPAGEQFVITGTTSLPAGTEVLWQVMPDTGTPPTCLDGNSQMSVGGNSIVTNGDGITNRISLTGFKNELIPGKYVVIVGEKKGDYSEFKISDRYGYTSFTLK